MKKYIAIFLSIIMLFAIAACSSGTGTPSSAPPSASPSVSVSASPSPSPPPAIPTATVQPSQSPSPSPSAPPPPASPDPGGKTDVLKIGALIHLTDWFAFVDMTNFYEFQAIAAYINDDLGGWKIGDTTYTIEPVIVDGMSNPDALRTGAMSMVDAGVKFTVVTNDFWVIACQDIFEEAGVMQLNNYNVFVPGYMSPSNPLTFTGCNGSVGDYAAGFEVLHNVYPDVKSVIFVNDDNGVNEGLFALMKAYGEQYGIQVLDNYLKYAGDTTDYSAIALQIVNSGADAFMGNGAPDAYGALLKEVRALGSDAVMACIQGKPVRMVMEFAPENARYNGFSLGASTKQADRGRNTDILNAIVDKVRVMFGDEQASNFDGAACNNTYILLQMMERAGSIDPVKVAEAWRSSSTVNTIYGVGTIGGLATYGVANQAVGNPKPVSIMNPSDPDGWEFWGWIDVTIP